VEARIVARERFVQQIIDLFKTYLKSANEAYKSWVFAEEEKRVRERAEKHRATIENEKVRQRILDEIKI
jgi:deoxyadenosine/deoxycytidine kinase